MALISSRKVRRVTSSNVFHSSSDCAREGKARNASARVLPAGQHVRFPQVRRQTEQEFYERRLQ